MNGQPETPPDVSSSPRARELATGYCNALAAYKARKLISQDAADRLASAKKKLDDSKADLASLQPQRDKKLLIHVVGKTYVLLQWEADSCVAHILEALP